MAFTNLVKDINGKLVTEVFRDTEPHSKQEIAGKTGLSFPTVSKLVEELVEKGVVHAQGAAEKSLGGRRAEWYRLNPDFAHVLTFFVQDRTLFWASCDVAGKVLASGRRECDSGTEGKMEYNGGTETEKKRLGVDSVECGLLEGMKTLLRDCTASDLQIRAVEIGIPGSVRDGRVCYIDGYDELKGVHLEQMLQDMWSGNEKQRPSQKMQGKTEPHQERCPRIQIVNNMRAVAEAAASRMEEKQNLACIHLAETGPGCGAIVNGQALDGFCGFNGEVGFIPFYGEKTLQDVALAGFPNTTPGEYLGKIMICISTVLNPAQIYLYLEKDWPRQQVDREICEYMSRYLPEEVIPEVCFLDGYRDDYRFGLMKLGFTGIFEDVNAGN